MASTHSASAAAYTRTHLTGADVCPVTAAVSAQVQLDRTRLLTSDDDDEIFLAAVLFFLSFLNSWAVNESI